MCGVRVPGRGFVAHISFSLIHTYNFQQYANDTAGASRRFVFYMSSWHIHICNTHDIWTTHRKNWWCWKRIRVLCEFVTPSINDTHMTHRQHYYITHDNTSMPEEDSGLIWVLNAYTRMPYLICEQYTGNALRTHMKNSYEDSSLIWVLNAIHRQRCWCHKTFCVSYEFLILIHT